MATSTCFIQGCRSLPLDDSIDLWLPAYQRFETIKFCTAHVANAHQSTMCVGTYPDCCPGDRQRDSKYDSYCTPCRSSRSLEMHKSLRGKF